MSSTTPRIPSGRASFIPSSPLPPMPALTTLSTPPLTPPKNKPPKRRNTTIGDDESIFDTVWKATCTTGNTIAPNELFKLLQSLELDLTSANSSNNFLTNDTVIKQRILEQIQQGKDVPITKDRAFEIISQCLDDVKLIDVDRGIIIGKSNKLDRSRIYHDNFSNMLSKHNIIDDTESLDDYDDTATLMEPRPKELSPVDEPDSDVFKHKRSDSAQSTKSNSSSMSQIRQTLQDLEKFHNKLDQQYSNLENDISSIKQKNDQDMKELKALIENNDSMIDRIDMIREELIDLSWEFNQYKEERGYDPQYFEQLKLAFNGELVEDIPEQDPNHESLWEKNGSRRVKSLSGIPVRKQAKENRRSYYGIVSKRERFDIDNENKEFKPSNIPVLTSVSKQHRRSYYEIMASNNSSDQRTDLKPKNIVSDGAPGKEKRMSYYGYMSSSNHSSIEGSNLKPSNIAPALNDRLSSDKRTSYYEYMARNNRLSLIQNINLKVTNMVPASNDNLSLDLKDYCDVSSNGDKIMTHTESDAEDLPLGESSRLDECDQDHQDDIAITRSVNSGSVRESLISVDISTDDDNFMSYGDITNPHYSSITEEMDKGFEYEKLQADDSDDLQTNAILPVYDAEEISTEEATKFWLAIIFLILALSYII